MKIIKYFALLTFLSILFFSCDKVTNPFPQANIVDTTNLNALFNDTVKASTGNVRKILLEDYTGQECGNCPQAADIASDLTKNYPNHVVVVAVHAGHFAEPNEFNPTYALDLTNEAGDIYDQFFGNSATGNPNGLVNRLQIPVGNYVIKPSQWINVIDSLSKSSNYANPPIVLDVENIYNTESRVNKLKLKTSISKNLIGNFNIIILGIEDKIIGNQKFYPPSGGTQTLYNYEFNHVLRFAHPQPWGELLLSGNANAGDVLETEYAFNISDSYIDQNVSLVVVVYEEATKEVYQTIYFHITE